jgi:hypothetical protein
MVGVIASTLVIGVTLNAMNEAYHTIEPAKANESFTVPAEARPAGNIDYRGKTYSMVFLDDVEDAAGLPNGKYLVENGKVAFRYVDGIGGRTLSAPQARLMSLVVSGILNQKLPWTLVLLGIFIGIVMELCGVHALPFAVGLYLPLSTTTPVFFGGLMKLVADKLTARRLKRPPASDEEASEGMLFSSGLIAGGALMGVGIAGLILASGRSQPLANALEALRGDGIRFELRSDCGVKAAGRLYSDGDQMKVRSRWFEHDIVQPDGSTVKKRELLPAIETNEGYRPFETLQFAAACLDKSHDAIVVEYEADTRARTLKFTPVDTWATPLSGDVKEWLVKEGAYVDYKQPLAKLADGSELKAPQSGQLHQLSEKGATLETRDPPAGQLKPADPTPRKRLVLTPRPGSDLFAMAAFLLLCAILVWSALPKGSSQLPS